MDFQLSPEQTYIQKAARDFAVGEFLSYPLLKGADAQHNPIKMRQLNFGQYRRPNQPRNIGSHRLHLGLDSN